MGALGLEIKRLTSKRNEKKSNRKIKTKQSLCSLDSSSEDPMPISLGNFVLGKYISLLYFIVTKKHSAPKSL